MAGAARLPHQAAFHSELLPASQSDRAAMGPDAQKRYAQQMLCNLCAIHRRDARFPARTSSSQLGALLRFGHRQLPRYLAQELSGHDVNGVYRFLGCDHSSFVGLSTKHTSRRVDLVGCLARPDRPETFRQYWRRPDIPHAERPLGELIAATPEETNLERDLGDQTATSADDQRAEPAQPQVP